MAQSIHSLVTVLQYAGKDEAIRRLHRLPQADVDRIVRHLDFNLVMGDGYAARQAEDAIVEAFDLATRDINTQIVGWTAANAPRG